MSDNNLADNLVWMAGKWADSGGSFDREVFADAKADFDQLKSKLSSAVAVLKTIRDDNYNCPWPDCLGEKDLVPCSPDCRLAALLREGGT
jgi:hypothetical protein